MKKEKMLKLSTNYACIHIRN